MGHTAVWTGSEMIVWGGWTGSTELNSGARYNPQTNRWTPLPVSGAPPAQSHHTAVWTGSEMIVWGGNVLSGPEQYPRGGRYKPATNSWAPVTRTGAPECADDMLSAWTGKVMLVWGVDFCLPGDPAVAALRPGRVDLGILLAVALRDEVLRRHPELVGENGCHRLGAPVRQGEIVLFGADQIGVALEQEDRLLIAVDDAVHRARDRLELGVLVGPDLP